MKNSIIAASIAAFATSAAAAGSQVVSACGADTVYLAAVSADGTCVQAKLNHGENWKQDWKQLTTGGWSIKLSKEDLGCYPTSNVTQYEYNMDAPPRIWWDMSNVNGQPFSSWGPYSDCETCYTVNDAYEYPEDNSAMQTPCDDDTATITILLCKDEEGAADTISSYGLRQYAPNGSQSGSSASVASVVSSASAPAVATSSAAAKTTAAATTEAAAATSSSVEAYSTSAAETSTTTKAPKSFGVVKEVAVPSTTLATSAVTSAAAAVSSPATTASAEANVVWVTDVQTAYETENLVHTVVVDSSGNTVDRKHRRHEHRHPHGHHH